MNPHGSCCYSYTIENANASDIIMKCKQTDNYRNCYNYKLDLNLDQDDKKCITPIIIYQTMVEVIQTANWNADVLLKFINKYHNSLMRNEKEFGVIDKLENDIKLLQNKNNDLIDEIDEFIDILDENIKLKNEIESLENENKNINDDNIELKNKIQLLEIKNNQLLIDNKTLSNEQNIYIFLWCCLLMIGFF
jgi:hypothetical protein